MVSYWLPGPCGGRCRGAMDCATRAYAWMHVFACPGNQYDTMPISKYSPELCRDRGTDSVRSDYIRLLLRLRVVKIFALICAGKLFSRVFLQEGVQLTFAIAGKPCQFRQ